MPTPPKSAPDTRYHKFTIEPDAFTLLLKQATTLGYIRETSTNHRGVSLLIVNLLIENPGPESWRDTRPEYYIQNHPIPCNLGWQTPPGEAARRRLMWLKSTQLNELIPIALKISMHFGMMPRQFNIPSAYLGPIVEAFALGYLTPQTLPPNPDPPKWPDRSKWRRTYRKDFDWLGTTYSRADTHAVHTQQAEEAIAERDAILELNPTDPDFTAKMHAIRDHS